MPTIPPMNLHSQQPNAKVDSRKRSSATRKDSDNTKKKKKHLCERKSIEYVLLLESEISLPWN